MDHHAAASSAASEPAPDSEPTFTMLASEPEPANFRIDNRRVDALGTAPASARTSFTRVNETRPGSVLDADGVTEGVEPEDSRRFEAEVDGAGQEESVPQTPKVSLTFLLVSGRRRTMSFEPDTTVGRVKELVWNAWPNDSEWQDERPPAPSYLRILYLGKILQDDDTLAKLNFPVTTATQSSPAVPQPPTTIVHLSIRPYAHPSEDENLKKKGKRRRRATDGQAGEDGAVGDSDAPGCCRCVIC